MYRFNFKTIEITIILILLLIYFSFVFVKLLDTTLKNDMKEAVLDINKRCADLLYHHINHDIQLLETIAVFVREEMISNSPIEKVLQKIEKGKTTTSFSMIGYLYPDGKTYVNESSDVFEVDFEKEDFFIKALEGESIVSGAKIHVINHNKVIVYATPVFGQNDTIEGVLFAVQDTEAYEKIFSMPIFKGEGFVYIVSDSGEVIAPPFHEKRYQNLANVFPLLEGKVHTFSIQKDLAKMKQDMLDGGEDSFEYEMERVKKILAYSPVGINQWYLLFVAPTEEIAEKANTVVRSALLISVLIVSVFTLLLILILFVDYKGKDKLMHLAFDDAVTGYGNFSEFQMNVTNLLQREKQNNYALIYFDIDKFKIVNDIYGYKIGNKILRFIADIVNASLKDEEFFSRINGDRFIILMKYTQDNEIVERIKQMKEAITAYKENASWHYELIVKMGIYRIKEEGFALDALGRGEPKSGYFIDCSNALSAHNLNSMIDKAQLARQMIKNSSFNHFYAFYDRKIRNNILREKEIEADMQNALMNGEFVFYLQPKYSLSSQRIAGAEALVRWFPPGKRMMAPDLFIPVFEKDGFIITLDFYIFEQVCKKLRQWLNAGYQPVPIAVNLSRLHIYEQNMIDKTMNIIEKYNIPTRLIEFELTESAMFEKMDVLLEFGNKLKKLGFSIAIDDFGSGYSSLNMLKDISVDILKLDKAFFVTKDQERSNKVIAKFIELSKSLNIKVVSEGVETKEQVDFLASIGCDMVQGYYFAKPMPIVEFEKEYFS